MRIEVRKRLQKLRSWNGAGFDLTKENDTVFILLKLVHSPNSDWVTLHGVSSRCVIACVYCEPERLQGSLTCRNFLSEYGRTKTTLWKKETLS